MLPFIEESNPSGLTDVPGFQAAAVACDIREQGRNDRLDLAVVRSTPPCRGAGVFTPHAFAAPPVSLCRETIAGATELRGFVVNSGNANACTGEQGVADARAMRDAAAVACGVDPSTFLICSTGRIGRPLPMPRILSGIDEAAQALTPEPEGGRGVARAILTSDSREKLITIRLPWEGTHVTIAGMAKGAGMIEPNMATMLAFIATDADLPAGAAQQSLHSAVADTFNAITVDGDQSTNDSVLLFANAASGVRVEPTSGKGGSIPIWDAFCTGLQHVCRQLADRIVSDGEKITKVVQVVVRGAGSRRDAETVARAIGNSLLVKTSWFGCDPNWGRVLDAAGYAGVPIDPKRTRMFYKRYPIEIDGSEIPVFILGEPTPEHLDAWRKVVRESRFTIVLDLGSGSESFVLLATDLTDGYVQFNKSE